MQRHVAKARCVETPASHAARCASEAAESQDFVELREAQRASCKLAVLPSSALAELRQQRTLSLAVSWHPSADGPVLFRGAHWFSSKGSFRVSTESVSVSPFSFQHRLRARGHWRNVSKSDPSVVRGQQAKLRLVAMSVRLSALRLRPSASSLWSREPRRPAHPSSQLAPWSLRLGGSNLQPCGFYFFFEQHEPVTGWRVRGRRGGGEEGGPPLA